MRRIFGIFLENKHIVWNLCLAASFISESNQRNVLKSVFGVHTKSSGDVSVLLVSVRLYVQLKPNLQKFLKVSLRKENLCTPYIITDYITIQNFYFKLLISIKINEIWLYFRRTFAHKFVITSWKLWGRFWQTEQHPATLSENCYCDNDLSLFSSLLSLQKCVLKICI
jgi:hypothetical protein